MGEEKGKGWEGRDGVREEGEGGENGGREGAAERPVNQALRPPSGSPRAQPCVREATPRPSLQRGRGVRRGDLRAQPFIARFSVDSR